MQEFDIDSIIAEVADAAPVPPAERVSKAPDPNLVAHIDGDVMAYTYAGPDTMPAGRCRINILKRVQQVKEFTGATRVVMHLTCGGSTKADRPLAATSRPYQGQRKKSRKPRNWSFCRDLMTDHDGSAYIPKIWKDREADDGVAYCVQATRERCGLQVISTNDKDLRMLPGLHLNWKTWHITEVPHGRFRVIGEDELVYGHAWFWQQMIQGDSVDHIPGLHGHGPAIAEATLAQVHDNEGAYAAVAALYRRAQGESWATYMAEQASLLWLRTDRWARTADFLQLGVFSPEVQDAALALQERVEARRRELLELRK